MDSHEHFRVPIEVDEMLERVDKETLFIFNAILSVTKEKWEASVELGFNWETYQTYLK